MNEAVSPNTATQMSHADILHSLGEILRRSSGIEDVTPDANLFEIGLDSLMMLTMHKAISSRFGVNIPVKSFFEEINTPARVAAYIAANMPRNTPA